MGERIKKLKKIRIHREGTSELTYAALIVLAVACIFYFALGAISPMARHIVMPVIGGIGIFVWLSMLNFYRCPIRYFNGDTEKLVVAPADGKIVVVEEADENEYFQDARVREAICHAIDINILTEMGAGILGSVAVGSFPAAMPYCVEGLTYDYDPDLSRQLLEEAGIADGEITLKYVTFNDPIKSASADIVKNDLANIGINVEISTLDNMSAVAEWMKEDGTDLQMMTAGGGVFELEPYGIFTFFYKDNVFFATNKDDPELNEYLDKGLSTVKPDERGEYWASAQQWLYDNFWVIPTYETYSAVAVGDTIESTGLYSALRPDLRFVEFK